MVSILVAVLTIANLETVVEILGARGNLIAICKEYLLILMIFAPISALQLLFQSFFVTAGKPKFGFEAVVSVVVFASALFTALGGWQFLLQKYAQYL